MEEIEKIYNLCCEFHSLIENVDKGKLSVKLKNFPKGACGDTSLLLGIYLNEHGFSTNYVCGFSEENDSSHAWLEYKDIIIDITAYQFPEIEDKIIVTKNSKWHVKIKRDKIQDEDSDINNYDEVTKEILKENYRIIIEALTKNFKS